tara:strand:- start:9999 stop:10439 length:441 start_codon:yes stop_codon:yes gene_type:complete
MSGSLNKVMLIGNLGDDIKMHHFEDGGCVGRFPLATNENYTNKQTGERVTNTEWHNIVVRNKAAEICNQYLKKGDKVYIEGKLKTRKWQAEDGQQRYSTEVHVNEFNFLNNRNESTAENSYQAPTAQPSQPSSESQNQDKPDDLPF